MRLNVDLPIKQQDIIDLLEAQEEPIYHFIGRNKNLRSQLQFEVEKVPEDIENLATYTKKLIKAQPYGGSIAFRVTTEE
ncbi:MAG: hypothetical protein IKS54_11225 [Erysipelotrichaceae bacterium]|nr:hypothetical protein [Erysipelotrichaceae bacterium]